MASRYGDYKVKLGDDIGDPNYLDSRFRDIDLRIVSLEDIEKDWTKALASLTETGLARIDEVLKPAYDEIRQLADLGAIFTAHSSSEMLLEAGLHRFTIDETERDSYAPASFVAAFADGDQTKALLGKVVSYERLDGVLSVDVSEVAGDGAATGWTIYPSTSSSTASDRAAIEAVGEEVLQHRNQCEDFKTSAEQDASVATQMRQSAVAANTQAQEARDTAVSCRDIVLDASEAAEAAADAAGAFSNEAAASSLAANASKLAAAASAGAAQASAGAAAGDASAASASAVVATARAAEAAASEVNAAASEVAALSARDLTVLARDDTVSAIDAWQTSVLPPSDVDPTTRSGGGALQVGDQYFKTVDAKWRTWDGVQWTVNAVPLGSEVASVFGRSGMVSAQSGDYRGDQVGRTVAQQGIVAGTSVEVAIQTLKTGLDSKSAVGHGHVIADVDGLQVALNGKAASSHTQAISTVTGLQAALDAKIDNDQAGATGLAVLGAADAPGGRAALGLGSFATRSSIRGDEVTRNAAQQYIIAGASVEDALQAVNTRVVNEEDNRVAAVGVKADKVVTITGGGLATGGGDLSADRVITVTEASQAEAQAGTASGVTMTPRRTKDAIGQLVPVGSTTVLGKVQLATSAEGAAGTSTTKVTPVAIVKAMIDAAISAMVGSTPAALDTLSELASAIGNDANFSATVTTLIGQKLNTSSYTAADVLAKLKTVDGGGSGIDADLLDGIQASSFARIDAAANFAQPVSFPSASGTNSLSTGTGDGASYTTYNLKVRGHWGWGFVANDDVVRGYYDFRTGTWDVKGGYKVNGNIVWHAGNGGSGSGLDADKVRGTTPGTFGLARLGDANAAAARSGLGMNVTPGTFGVARLGDADVTAARTALGLGSAAYKNYGTGIGNLVEVQSGYKLPTLSGANLTDLPVPDKLSTASGSAPSYSARAWVSFSGAGTPSINASGNVSSLTDVGTGEWTVNFSVAMPHDDYAYVAAGKNASHSSLSSLFFNQTSTSTKTTATCSIRCIYQYGTAQAGYDPPDVCVVFFA